MRFWPRPEPGDEPERFDTREPDPVEAAFEDYQTSIQDLLDEFPERSAELSRRLDEATAVWERTTFDLIARPLRRDLRFRLAMFRASRTKSTQT